MPKATAVWLIDNTSLSFDQIADFCGMHPLEVQGIADGEVATGIIGEDPVASGQLNEESIKECEKDPNKRLMINAKAREYLQTAVKGSRYTPRARRQDKPEAIAWIVKYHPYIPDSQIVKLIGTTKKTIDSIRSRSHWNINNIQPKDPVLLGLCSQSLLDQMIKKHAPAAPAESAAEGDAA
ncbi:MAG: cell cycle transcriptional regulator TrcR [Rickettsiales bacterium]